MKPAVGRVCITDDFAGRVDSRGAAESATQGTEVRHLPVPPEEGVPVAVGGARLADFLAGRVDAEALALGPT